MTERGSRRYARVQDTSSNRGIPRSIFTNFSITGDTLTETIKKEMWFINSYANLFNLHK